MNFLLHVIQTAGTPLRKTRFQPGVVVCYNCSRTETAARTSLAKGYSRLQTAACPSHPKYRNNTNKVVSMPVEKITPVLNVNDVGSSFEWFEKFGWERSFSWNNEGLIGEGPSCASEDENGPASFGGVCQGEVNIFLCQGAQGSQGTRLPSQPGADDTDGTWMTWWVNSKQEVDRLHQIALDNEFIVTWPPTDEPWGVRECHLRHPDGHMFRVSCGID